MDLPFINISTHGLAEGWEKSVISCWEQGIDISTQYDLPGDPPSKEVSLCLVVDRPFSEPRIHRAMPGGIYDLEVYTQEVVNGIHDHWIDPEAGKWQYTYHERMSAYSVPGREPINQLDYVLRSLSSAENSRRAQVIIWKPWEDGKTDHPACLQRLWFRLIGDRLMMAAHMRSNDAYKAAFMNMFAFTELQADMSRRLSLLLGRPILPGQYNHIVDSFHIYGSYFSEFEGFLASLETRTFEQRTYTTNQVAVLFKEARESLVKARSKD